MGVLCSADRVTSRRLKFKDFITRYRLLLKSAVSDERSAVISIVSGGGGSSEGTQIGRTMVFYRTQQFEVLVEIPLASLMPAGAGRQTEGCPSSGVNEDPEGHPRPVHPEKGGEDPKGKCTSCKYPALIFEDSATCARPARTG